MKKKIFSTLVALTTFLLTSCSLFKDNDIKINFIDGGRTVLGYSLTEPGKIGEPSQPEKTGYAFTGWYDGDKKWDFGTDVFENSTDLVAGWELTNYSITYHLDNGNNHADNIDSYTILSSGPIMAATKDGYAFDGWYLDEYFTNKVEDFGELPLRNINLYVHFVLSITLRQPSIVYDGKILSWTSPDHDQTNSYELYIDNQLIKNLGRVLAFGEINDYINDGLRHEIAVKAIGVKYTKSSELSERLIKLEIPTINATNEELISEEVISWQKVSGASGYKIIKEDGEEINFDSNTLTYNFSGYLGYNLKLFALGTGNYITSEQIEKIVGKAKVEDDFIYFGEYPQTVVSDAYLVSKLKELTITNGKGYYEFKGDEYAKLVANPYDRNMSFIDGTSIVANQTYFFKVEPIQWLILEKNLSTYTVLSQMLLDAEAFSDAKNNIIVDGNTIYPNNYEHSYIREWLNNDFYNQAFNNIVKDSILTSFVDNSTATTYSTSNPYVSNDTNDKVYLLSRKEAASKYFSTASTRTARKTDYARAQYTYGRGYGEWWVRSPHELYSTEVVRVDDTGTLTNEKILVNFDNVRSISICVRPAVKINLS